MNLRLVLQIVLGVLIVGLVLLQNQGTGLGSGFGGSNVSYHSKKGLEKYVFGLTIGLITLFVLLAVLNISI